MNNIFHTTVDKGGRVVIPSEARETLHLPPGTRVVVEVNEDEVRIRSMDATIRRIQERCKQFAIPGVSIVDELIAERRAEAAREEEELAASLAEPKRE